MSYERIGDVLVAQGNLPEALKAYRDGLAIRERLSRADPGNARWQRDLSVSHFSLAETCKAAGHGAQAMSYYRIALEGFEKLAALDPSNAQWQRDCATAQARLTAAQSQLTWSTSWTGCIAQADAAREAGDAVAERGALAGALESADIGEGSRRATTLRRLAALDLAAGDAAAATALLREVEAHQAAVALARPDNGLHARIWAEAAVELAEATARAAAPDEDAAWARARQAVEAAFTLEPDSVTVGRLRARLKGAPPGAASEPSDPVRRTPGLLSRLFGRKGG